MLGKLKKMMREKRTLNSKRTIHKQERESNNVTEIVKMNPLQILELKIKYLL